MRESLLRPPGFAYRSTGDQGRVAKLRCEALYCEDVDLERLATRHGTPLYVYSAAMIRARLKAFRSAFRTIPHTLCYSVKANSTLAILRLIAAEGAGFDVVSGGEMQRVLRVNRKAARQVVFSGVGKTAAEMELALRSGILLFNVESASELKLLSATAARLKKRAAVAMRVNPDVSAKTHPYISTGLHQHKFGVPIPEAQALYAQAAKERYLSVTGVSVHIGSQITDVGTFQEALARVVELVRVLRGQGHDIRYIDAGGGLGISYEGVQPNFEKQIAAYARAVIGPSRGMKLHLLLEPGRSIVGAAGVLLTRVLYRKTNHRKRFLIVDAAMNNLMRPSLYGAYHEIVPVRRASCEIETTDVVGPICETGDFFARDRKLPLAEEGELLAILDVGAYGAVLGSNYNTRGRAAEVLVDGAKAKVIRRRESVEDQLRMESRLS
ncbi:MAG TPA: diaminopimelate decarboxylase [Terriglobales bacterium]|jgi:diaminopimelate decarboxylase|nr:diaminopimelate decarboxylase [Terriglobales bacterium]